MTKTFEELEAQVADLAIMVTTRDDTIAGLTQRIKALETFLHGDPQATEQYRQNRAIHMAPNIPEPPRAYTERIDEMFASAGRALEARVKPLQQLLAFFQPLIDELTRSGHPPPLDAKQIPTQGYVDRAIERLGNALRAEFGGKRPREVDEANAFSLATAIIERLGSGTIPNAVERLLWLYDRELERDADERARASRPSRIASLLHAVTGVAPNGRPR